MYGKIIHENRFGDIIITAVAKNNYTDGKKVVCFPDESQVPEGWELVPMQYYIDRFVEKGCKYAVKTKEELPDSYFMDAWRFDENNELYIDKVEALEVQKNKWRRARFFKFEELGFPYKLDEDLERAIIPQEKVAILQNLRDLPATLDDLKNSPEDINLEELKNTWPEILL